MKLPVFLYGENVLREIAKPVPADYPELKKLVEDMFETMDGAAGVGLAAPQIGLALRMFVVDGSPCAESFPECADSRMAMINPELEVIEDCEPCSREEGCLSLPGLSEPVKRTEHIKVKWLDEDLNPHEKEFTGFLSRIIQHEYDHLDGKVYMDRVSPIRRQLNKNKLTAIAKGKVSCDYRVKQSRRR